MRWSFQALQLENLRSWRRKKCLPLTFPSLSIFFHDLFMLLFLKLLEKIQSVDGIGLIFVGMYILGRDVGRYAFHFMGHFRSKVMDEPLNYV